MESDARPTGVQLKNAAKLVYLSFAKFSYKHFLTFSCDDKVKVYRHVSLSYTTLCTTTLRKHLKVIILSCIAIMTTVLRVHVF